jgi:antigen flippase
LQQDMPQTTDATTTDKHSYGQILKSSALIGGSQALDIAIRMVRTKAMAVLLGPAGIGLMSLYSSITSFAQSIAEMGINSSGVRQIAEAVGSGETERIAQTATVLRRISVLLGLFGASLLIVFSSQVSMLTFGNDQHAGSVALLSLVVLFGCVSGAQGALIQGMRRIADLAKIQVLGALFGTLISIPVVYFYGEQGVVLSLIGVGFMSLLISWWYSRKIRVQMPYMMMSKVGREAAALLKLGFAFMASMMMMTGAAYAVRLILLHKVGFEAAGLYQAAWALGGLYVGVILQAMGADFYPRLTAVAKDNIECNRIVNEQEQIGLLLTGPGVIGTLTFAPLVIALFYSSEFDAAVGILRWLCLGITLRVIIWPMGYIIIVKGEQSIFIFTELVWTVVNVGLSWLGLTYFGLNGVGIAFFGSYIVHGLIIYLVVRNLSGFRLSAANRKIGLLFLSLVAVVFYGFNELPFLWATGFGILVMTLSGVFSIRVLLSLISQEHIPRPILRMLVWMRIAPLEKFLSH